MSRVSLDQCVLNREIGDCFIDAAATVRDVAYPVALNRVTFDDNHLIYALTWYTMALFGLGFVVLLGFPRLLMRAVPE